MEFKIDNETFTIDADASTIEFYVRTQDERRKISEEALARVLSEERASCSWIKTYQLKSSLSNSGEKLHAIYNRIHSAHNSPDDLARDALRFFWIAEQHNKLKMLDWITAGLIHDSHLHRPSATSLNFTDEIGQAFYIDITEPPLSATVKSISSYSAQSLLDGLAMAWLCEADDLIAANKLPEAMNAIADAFSVIGEANQLALWREAEEFATDESSATARKKAISRHASTYAKEQEVIAYWRNEIPDNMPNEWAAEQLAKKFTDLSHRTLVKYVAKAKKLPPAGTQ